MLRPLDTTKRGTLFAAPFALLALGVIGFGLAELTRSTPESWTLVITVIVGVMICGSLQLQVGRRPGFPLVGIAIVMIAIPPMPGFPLFNVAVWALGLLISQTFLHRNVRHALYLTGLGAVSALAFVLTQSWLANLGVWVPLSYLAATSAYYALFLMGEFLRQWSNTESDRNLGLSAIDPLKLTLVVLIVGATSTAMNYADTQLIPWLEQDPRADLTPLVVLLAASLFYMFAQHSRFSHIERRLSALVNAAVELPRITAQGGLAPALLSRTQTIVQAKHVELREAPPERHEIGAPVRLDAARNEYLVASRKTGGVPFEREDERALTTLAHVASETTRAQHEVEDLERRANTDDLTGLPNYGAFQKALIEANENRSYHAGIALLFVDLDNFKKLNDAHGHRIGDELLKTVAQRLLEASGGGDFVSRVGGDEFVIIFSDLDSLDQAKASADRIVEIASQAVFIEGHQLRPTLSAGLAFSGHRELDPQALVEDADRAMLHVKRSRRRGGAATGSGVSVSSHRASRTNDIVARAIREDRLLVAFQPIVSLERGEIWAFEALVRYVDPELGPISPPSLVARAKSLGLMNELTKQVISKALDAADEFHRLEPGIECMTVNLEVGQITDSELGSFVREAARTHPDVSLCIELNERSLHGVTDELRRDAEALQQDGVLLALDDYGSDASSVGALVHFPMNILKVDKSLIDDLGDARQREVVKALQGFGDRLGYTVIVEGVETREMADVLTSLGVRSVQGYYFGRPLSFAQTMSRLRGSGTRALFER